MKLKIGKKKWECFKDVVHEGHDLIGDCVVVELDSGLEVPLEDFFEEAIRRDAAASSEPASAIEGRYSSVMIKSLHSLGVTFS